MNILFINPPNNPFSSKGILIEPIDMLHLATYIKNNGHNVTLLDMDVKNKYPKDIEYSEYDAVVIIYDYHIPLHDIGVLDYVKEICFLAKQHNTKVILGGKFATFCNDEKLINLGADIYVMYEMEQTLKTLFSSPINDWNLRFFSFIPNIRYIHKNKLYSNTAKKHNIDLNSCPIPNRNLIDLSDYIDVRTLLSSRGCNLKCTFCHVPGFWGNWRSREYNHVVDEIEILVNDHSAKKILFLDDNATAHSSRMIKISEEILKRNIKTTLGCLGTVNKFNYESMQIMHQAGFRWIHYGAESGDNVQLLSMGKKINKEDTLLAVQQSREIGFRVRTSWILDLPDLSKEGIINTEKTILEQDSEEIRLHFLTLRLGSILHNTVDHFETPQFIHNSKPNLNISGVSDSLIQDSVHRIIDGLKQKGYYIVYHPDEFLNLDKIKQNNPNLKIASLCPLRYGINWK